MIGTALLSRRTSSICGVLASFLYAGTDIIAGTLWEGYSFAHQAVSELSAIGAPTRPLVVPLYFVHDGLMMMLGMGVLGHGRRRAQRLMGGLLVGYSVVGVVGLLFPIHQRGATVTFTDTAHSALAGVTVLLIVLAIGCGAFSYGRRFRLYSKGTLLALLVLGAVLGFMSGTQIGDQGTIAPPQWFGLIERIDIYGFLLWVVALATVQWRAEEGRGFRGGSGGPDEP